MRLKAGKYMIPVETWNEGRRLFFKFGFNRDLMEEIKKMDGAKYHGYDEDNPRKLWSIHDNQRNRFQLQYLEFPGSKDPNNPYYRYNLPLQNFEPSRSLMEHQREGLNHILTRRCSILAYDLGLGKSLICIEAIEITKAKDVIWVAPKSAMYSVMLEHRKWKCQIPVRFMTYETMKKLVEAWPAGKPAPDFIIFDEASRLKNPTAQRSQAAQYLANSCREEWKDKGYVVLLSGTPAPKSPVDWFSLSEIARPGFLVEGNINKLRQRLAIIEQQETFAGGGSYAKLITWKDDSLKCNICGLPVDAETHSVNPEDTFNSLVDQYNHLYQPSINEVELLYKRLNGLVLVKTKEMCVSLPDKIYREIEIKPTQSMINAAKLIQAGASSTIQALTMLRELSDGFQYQSIITGKETCTCCNGSKTIIEYEDEEGDSTTEAGWKTIAEHMSSGNFDLSKYKKVERACDFCNGTGEVNSFSRDVREVPSPKEDILRELLVDHNDIGRIVIYGGFTGSIDKICRIVRQLDWQFIRVDGRGWLSPIDGKPTDLLEIFQDRNHKIYDKIAFVAQSGSGGMGLTLTASPTIIYYSNDFNAESRQQSEGRVHRIGMDPNRGCNIIDLLCLPSDKLVLDNLKKKKKLQDMSLGLMIDMIKEIDLSEERNL